MTTIRSLLVLSSLALALGACSKKDDACAGITEGCITATIHGSVGQLDQLRITLDRPQPTTRVLPGVPDSSLSLPVSVAIVPPAGLAGQPVSITIDGLLSGNVHASGPSHMVTVPASGEHLTVDFELAGADTPDLLLADLSGADFAGTTGGSRLTASLNPIVFDDTQRGVTAARITVTLSNPSDQPLTLALNSPMGDKSVDFDFGGPGTTCNTITTAFPPHASCDLAVVFHPQSSGPLTSTILFQFTDAPDFALVATGTGTRTWSAETFSNPYNFTAVHGSERNDIYVVDQSSGNSVQHWNGATWSNVTGHGIVDPHLTSVYALDATHVWVGGSDSTAQGISSTSDQGLNWSPNLIVGMATGSGNIHTLYAATATNLFAVTDTSAGGLVLHSTNGLNWSSAGMVLGNMPIRTLGVMGSTLLVGGDAGLVSYGDVSGSFSGSFVPNGVSTDTQILGIWGDRNAHKWYFIGRSSGGSTGTVSYTIYSMMNGMKDAMLEMTTASELAGISGRHGTDPAPCDIYVAGALGNRVYHSTCDGKWPSEVIPTNAKMNSVYVDPSGDVVLAGDSGAISHFR